MNSIPSTPTTLWEIANFVFLQFQSFIEKLNDALLRDTKLAWNLQVTTTATFVERQKAKVGNIPAEVPQAGFAHTPRSCLSPFLQKEQAFYNWSFLSPAFSSKLLLRGGTEKY